MLSVSIPGRDKLEIKNLILDFNGTIATDGIMKQELKQKIEKIKTFLKVFILTSDTYSSVQKECDNLEVDLYVLRSEDVSMEKRRIARAIGAGATVCIGNGVNDIGMFEVCALSIIVIGDEGCSTKAITKADIAVKNVEDAFELILNPKRIAATLRE